MSVVNYVNSWLVYNAGHYGLAKVEDFLNYLVDQPPTDQNLVAYRHLLMLKPGQQHFVGSAHFLTKAHPDYGIIYILSGCPDNLILHQDHTTTQNLANRIYPSLLKLSRDEAFERKVKIITDRTVKQPQADEVALVIRSRSKNLFAQVDQSFRQTLFENILAVDWIQEDVFPISSDETLTISPLQLFYHPATFLAILNEWANRREHYPTYWSKISKDFLKFFDNIWQRRQIFPDDRIPTLISKIFPYFLPAEVENFSSTARFIYQLSPFLQGYFLGFPVHYQIPTDQQLVKALEQLSKGIDEYCQKCSQSNRQNITASYLNFLEAPASRIMTSQNSLFEEIFNYSCFDIIPIQRPHLIWLFNRVEFDKILENGKNFWNNQEISADEIIQLSFRKHLAEIYHLPASLPLVDLLKQVETYQPFYHKGMVLLQALSSSETSDDETLNNFANYLLEFLT